MGALSHHCDLRTFAGGVADQRSEAVEERAIVFGSGRGLRMVLHREDWQLFVRQPFHAAIREIEMADVEATAGGQRRRVYLEIVILRGNGDDAST